MSNNIVEENPAQDSKAPSGPQGQGATGSQDKVRKQARQLAYDVRYKVKQSFKDGQKSDPASLKNAYISQLGRSPAPGPVKALAKKMLVGESYDFVDVKENVSKNISNTIGKVFTKTTQIDDVDGNPAYEITDVVQEDSAVRKYKVRVTDKKSGKSYTRMADRAKISELRKNPNISSVEMTGYGTPYEGEKKKGSQTAAVKSGKGLAKKDFDGDGKRETPTAEYKGSKDKAIKKALHREEFIDEVNTEDDNPQANTKKIDVMKGKNKVKVMPNMGEQNELAPKGKDAPAKPEPDAKEKRVGLMKRMILQKKMQAVRSGAGADIVAHNEPEGNLIAENEPPIRDQDDQQIANVTFDGGGPDGGATIKGSGDPREIPTFVSLIKNKMRARGILVNHNELEGEVIQEKPDIGDIIARLEKKRISKGGDPKDSPLPAMKKYHAKKKKVKKGDWIGPPPKKEEVENLEGEVIDETYFDTNRRGISTKGGFVKQYNKPGKLSRASLNHERKSKNPELRMSKKELRKSMEDDANYEKKMGRSKPTPSNLKTALKKQRQSTSEEFKSVTDTIRGILEGEQLDELNKAERVDAGQGKRAAKKGDWSKQKAKTGKRNINRFETKPVEREEGSLNKGKQSFKKVKVLNPKSGYSKKTDATKGKVTSRKLSPTGTDLKPDYGPQKPHWAGNVHSDRAQQQRRSEHKARRGVKTKGTVAADIKKSMKETVSVTDTINQILESNSK